MFLKKLERIFLNFFSEPIQRLASFVRQRAEQVELLKAKEFRDERIARQVEEKKDFDNSLNNWKLRTQSLPPQDWLDRVRAGAPELLLEMPEHIAQTESLEEVSITYPSNTQIDKSQDIDEKIDFVKDANQKQKVEPISEAFQKFIEAGEKTSENISSTSAKPKIETKALLFNFGKLPKKQEDFVAPMPESATQNQSPKQQSDQQYESGKDLTKKAIENETNKLAVYPIRELIKKESDCETSKKQEPLRFVFKSKNAISEKFSSRNCLQSKSTMAKNNQIHQISRVQELNVATDFHDEKQISSFQTKFANPYLQEGSKSVQKDRKNNWQTDHLSIFKERSTETKNSSSNYQQQSNRPKLFDAADLPLTRTGFWVDLPEETFVSESDEFETLISENERLQNLESEQTNRF